nr:MAG TPA: hypothetical protein [Caudoviricetes sp.]
MAITARPQHETSFLRKTYHQMKLKQTCYLQVHWSTEGQTVLSHETPLP